MEFYYLIAGPTGTHGLKHYKSVMAVSNQRIYEQILKYGDKYELKPWLTLPQIKRPSLRSKKVIC